MNPQDTPAKLSGALEDYLETIFQLVTEKSFARVRDIAKARKVKAGSVSQALKRLSDLGLINYAQREYVDLTPEGEKQARRVFARHQILIKFFNEILQMPYKSAEDQACALEHSLTDEGMDRMVRFFEFISACPRSTPGFIEHFHSCSLVHSEVQPCQHHCQASAQCENKNPQPKALSDLVFGSKAQVAHIEAEPQLRQSVLDRGLFPGVAIEVLERAGKQGMVIRAGQSKLAIDLATASAVKVMV